MARGEKPGHQGQKKSSAGSAIIKALLALIFVGLLAIGGSYFYAMNQLTAAGPTTADGEARIITIPRGANVPSIAGQLEEIGAIEDDLHFRLAARYLDATTRMKAGEFAIPSGASLQDIVEVLTDGRSILYPVTVPEGLTTEQVLTIIAGSETLTGDLPNDVPAEGSLLPDTYMVQRGEDRTALINRMQAASRSVLETAWAQRQEGLPLENMREALILASIVEKETGLAEERPRIAAVFVNRLRKPMRLQTDPTIIYGVCKLHPDRCLNGRLVDSDGIQRGIRQSEIRMDTGYNTYQIDGLPPGPICNPGKDAIEAVLNPPSSNEYYFVADGSGGHAFARTHSEHLRNVANWRRIERERR